MARRHKKTTSVISTAVSSTVSSRMPSRASSPSPPKRPFRFFALPAELRLKIYEEALHMKEPVDLHENNYRTVLPRLALFLVCKRMHEEAYRVFYAQTIRLFPLSGRFFYTKAPLVQRLPFKYREAITTMELRLGPGFSAPPRCQNTKPSLGLMDCVNLRTLKVFVECDPSDPVFAGFRGAGATEDTYKWFCVDLLAGILQQVPSLEVVELDAFPSITKSAPIIIGLVQAIQENRRKLAWGPTRRWEEDEEPKLLGNGIVLATMAIAQEAPLAVSVYALRITAETRVGSVGVG